MKLRVMCPDCGPQEHRGYVNPFAMPEDGQVSRHVQWRDDRCPLCGSETVPVRTDLAVAVAVASTEYFEKEEAAARAERRTARRIARRALFHDRVTLRIVVG